MALFRRAGSPIAWMVALNVMGVNMITPILPAYADHFGVGFAVMSSLFVSFAAARMAFRVPAGALADRYGSRVICVGGGVVQAVGAVAAALAPSFGLLLATRFLQGMGSSMFGTAANRYLLVTNSKSDLGRATAGFQSGILIGNTVGPIVGGVAAETFGIWSPFWLQAAAAAFLSVVSARYIRDVGTDYKDRRVPKPIRMLFALKGFKVIMLMAFGLFFVRAGATNVLVPAFADRILGMSPAGIGYVIGLGSLTSLAIMGFAGRLVDRRGRRPVTIAGAFTAAMAMAAFGLVDSAIGLTVVSAVAGVGAGMTAVALPTMVGDLAPAGTEGLASGLYRISNDFGWMVGPILLGLMADGGRFGIGFVVSGIPLLVGGIVFAKSMPSNEAP